VARTLIKRRHARAQPDSEPAGIRVAVIAPPYSLVRSPGEYIAARTPRTMGWPRIWIAAEAPPAAVLFHLAPNPAKYPYPRTGSRFTHCTGFRMLRVSAGSAASGRAGTLRRPSGCPRPW
jgi:hypothetical protein